MNYQLDEVHLKLKQLSDKMGSDYFVLPVFLNFFETATLDFVGERLSVIEKTQQITDDIRTLIVSKDIPVIEDENESGIYIAGLPADYHTQVAYDVFYNDGYKCRRADLVRQSEYVQAKNNPNKKPTKHYPLIRQFASNFSIDCGSDAPTSFRLVYASKPIFATTGEPTKRIVNLPDQAIEKILKTTVTNLFSTTADQRTQTNYQLQEAYRKVFR